MAVPEAGRGMLHLVKLCVGVGDVAELRRWQTERAKIDPPIRHRTRNFPRRAAEIIDGGSLYWVIAGAIIVRQRVLDIIEDHRDDGTRCAAIVLHRRLVAVAARPMKAFQGWRYLQAADAPPDIVRGRRGEGEQELPEALRRDLRALGLL
jgi:hypothetical protein